MISSPAFMVRFFEQILARGRALLTRSAQKGAVKRYRPERHYMRGPGPQWHAKHDPASAPGALEPRLQLPR
jgi:hypothetical protein